MSSLSPDESSRRPEEGDNPLKGQSLSGIERVSFNGLSRESVEYCRALVSLCLLAHSRRIVSLDEAAREAVRELDLFEWSQPYPKDVTPRSFPFFSSDYLKHQELTRLEAERSAMRRAQAEGEPFRGAPRAEPVHPNTPISLHMSLVNMEQSIDEIFDGLRRRCTSGISAPEGKIRLTNFGEILRPLLLNKPTETGAQIMRMVLRAEESGGKATRRPIVEHMQDLWEVAHATQPNKGARLEAFNMHLRKLGVAMLEGQVSFEREDLHTRSKRILCEGHVDTFLSEARTRAQLNRYHEAYQWLRGFDAGQHGSVPYGSWHPEAKEESFNEAYRIVARNRHLSYHFFNRLRMETRTLGRELSLFREFALENFEDVRFVRSDNIDLPPGGGTVMSGADVEKLFHGLNPDRGVLHEYQRNKSLWFADQVGSFGSATFAALRQWVGVSADSRDFYLFGTRYYFIFDNNHFSGSYLYGYGIPAVVVEAKLREATFGLDEVSTSARDSYATKLSIPDLLMATRSAGMNPLLLGHMSPLFGGMCNALPVGSKPVFQWELKHQTSVWRDVYGHVHWPWLVNSFRDNRPKVDETIRDLAKYDRLIRSFSVSSQKLIEAFRHRYAAWKNDMTPGDEAAPRMLAVAYDIYRDHEQKGSAAKHDETIYIAAQDRKSPIFDPIPLLNCFTLELSTRHITYSGSLPRKGNGAGKAERSMWKRHVSPLTTYRGPNGELFEGPYELMIVGERDIKRG